MPAAGPPDPRPVDAAADVLRDVEAVLFDMDGTLLVLDAPWERLRDRLAGFLEDEVLPTGPQRPSSETLRDLRAQDRHGEARRVVEAVREVELQGVPGSWLVPRGVHLLDRARELDVPRGVVSNNHQDTVDRALAHHGLADDLHPVLGLGGRPELKPDPRGLLEGFKTLGVALDDALYVGNDWKDHAAGRAAGVPTVDVATYRPGDPEPGVD